MNIKSIKSKVGFIVLSLFLLDLISYLAFFNLSLLKISFIIIVLAGVALTIYKLEYGILILLAELLIGSKGYLFYWPIGERMIPIRMVLWAMVMLVFAIKFLNQFIRSGRASEYYQKIINFSYLKYFALFGLFIIIGVINGFLRGHSYLNIYSDFNAFIYLLLIFPAIVIYTSGKEKDASDKKQADIFSNLKMIFLGGAIYLSLETLILLFIFTHNLNIAPDIYAWLRKTLIGEMTPTLSGWPRIFIQSQIYPIIAFLFIAFKEEFKKNNILLAALFLSSALISFSRSFWLALAVTIIFSLILIWRYQGFKKLSLLFLKIGSAGILSFLIIYIVAIFPYPKMGAFNADFLNRISNGGESAISSRWSLMPELFKEIKREPILGQGYGATVTYKSSDPRILQDNPSGIYTTYAFEWGYLDLWLKIGLLGLLSYFILLFVLIKKSFKKKNINYLNLGLGTGLVFLTLTHIFTPYLNHPLGFGFLIIASCLIPLTRVY
ncbi:MAG: O-antigen ligase family protein [Patescibacteria group bacterium]